MIVHPLNKIYLVNPHGTSIYFHILAENTTMAKREQFFRLFDIINILKKNTKGATYDEILNYVERQHQERDDETSEVAFSEKTFKRDRDLILNFFGIEIKYRRSTHTYKIDEFENFDHASAMYDNLLLVNAYRRTKDQAAIMHFEKRQASGLHNMEGIIYAIKNSKIISLNYTKHWEGIPLHRVVEPYALKEFRNRWYLLANDTTGKEFFIKTFGLDRISDLDIHTKNFEKQPANIEEMFNNSFGIISTLNEKPTKIVLSFDHDQGKFVKTLPIHHSQRILVDNQQEFRIELTLCPTYDFFQELLSHAERLRIVEPESVRKEYLKFLQHAREMNTIR